MGQCSNLTNTPIKCYTIINVPARGVVYVEIYKIKKEKEKVYYIYIYILLEKKVGISTQTEHDARILI